MTSLIELRVLEGPNLYFPRATIKLTLDISPLASAPTATAERLARRIGLPGARPGEPDTGFRQRFALRAVARLVRAIAHESGAVRLAVRVRPTHDPHVVVVAYPWRHRERAEEMGRAVAEVLDAVPGADVEEAVGRAAEQVAASPEGALPHTITPEIPVVAVTGTNGKTTTSRMIAHIARTGGQVVGWSNTDGIYLDGALVEAGDYSGPSGAGHRARPARRGVRRHRDRARRHPAEGDRCHPQRRVGGDERQRRPPRPAGHRHPRPARRGQGGGPADHPAPRLGGAQRRRPPGLRDAQRDPGPPVGLLPRPELAGDPRDPRRTRPRHHRHRRLGRGAAPGRRRRPAGRARRRSR